jgi:hypothetical protein
MGQQGLVDHPDRLTIGFHANRAPGLAVDVHSIATAVANPAGPPHQGRP